MTAAGADLRRLRDAGRLAFRRRPRGRAAARPAAPGLDAGAFADAWRARYKPSMETVRPAPAPTSISIRSRRSPCPTCWPSSGSPAYRMPCRASWSRPGTGSTPGQMCPRPWRRLRERAPAGAEFERACPADGRPRPAQRPDRSTPSSAPAIPATTSRSRRSYRDAVAALGFAPGETLMVAAHSNDLAAAARARAVDRHVARPLEHGPGRGERLRACR